MTNFTPKLKKGPGWDEEDLKEEVMEEISNRRQQSSLPSSPQLFQTVRSPAFVLRSTKLRGAAGPLRGRRHHHPEMKLFKKAKSAATFTLDGVSYTIGKYQLIFD